MIQTVTTIQIDYIYRIIFVKVFNLSIYIVSFLPVLILNVKQKLFFASQKQFRKQSTNIKRIYNWTLSRIQIDRHGSSANSIDGLDD